MTDSLQRNLGVSHLRPAAWPFPHAIADQFFRPAVYEKLRHEFPHIGTSLTPGNGERSLYWGDDEYERHLEESPSWKDVFQMVQSQAFVSFMIDQFGDYWEREGCTLDLSKARFVPYIEDRIDKGRLSLRRVDHSPHELWCRLDFSESKEGSYGPLHRDLRRRLISMLVYLDRPKDAVSFEDGLILHRCGIDLQLVHRLRVGRVPKVYSLVRDRIARTTRVPARANRMIVLLNSNRSWHSVPKVQPARQIRIVVSSSVDIWA